MDSCCKKANHKSANCNSVTSTNEGLKILSDQKLCFSCTGTKHQANECKNENTCRTRKHHASICDKIEDVVLNTNERNTYQNHRKHQYQSLLFNKVSG